MTHLSVNIDHIATIRQARKTVEPDPVHAAILCELAGADGITCHLREDRRHIQDRDVEVLIKTVRSRVNLEMACTEEMIDIALKLKPSQVTIVPEKRTELTTEGGLDVISIGEVLTDNVSLLKKSGITVSLFVDPDEKQITASAKTGADFIELHTGAYANRSEIGKTTNELDTLIKSAEIARTLGLGVNAGHGLNYKNTGAVAAIYGINELNIGHSIISRAALVGIERAVREMITIIARQFCQQDHTQLPQLRS